MTTVVNFTLGEGHSRQVKRLPDINLTTELLLVRNEPFVKADCVYTGTSTIRLDSISLTYGETCSEHPILSCLSQSGSTPKESLCHEEYGIYPKARFKRIVCYFKVFDPQEDHVHIEGTLQYSKI